MLGSCLVFCCSAPLSQWSHSSAGSLITDSTSALPQCEADPETLQYSQKFLAKIRDEVLAKEGVSE